MKKNVSRRHFLLQSAIGTAGLITLPSWKAKAQNGKPKLDAQLVHDFVYDAHGNLDSVKKMLEKEPGLLNATMDWGAGDFETALEAAGHMGRKDIALFLLENGGRMNIFCAAMLGKLDIVKGVLSAFPDLKTSKGPHGLKLIHHATQGGEEAKAVLTYLKEIGAG